MGKHVISLRLERPETVREAVSLSGKAGHAKRNQNVSFDRMQGAQSPNDDVARQQCSQKVIQGKTV